MPIVTVERTYLRLEAATPFIPGDGDLPRGVTILEARPCSASDYRELYAAVGAPYFWRDRSRWSDGELANYLALESVRVWVLRDEEGAGGFFELQRRADGSVEIAYFGLVSSRHGRGLGRMLLSRAIEEGWRWGATSLWLHTCTLDGPAALPNYLARGFLPFRTERYEELLPDS